MGAGAVGLGVGGVFAVLSFSKRAEADAAFVKCGAGCYGPEADAVRALDEDANKRGTIGVISLASGGALAAAGVIIFVVSGKSSASKTSAWTVVPFVGPSGGGLAGRF